ncbi:hypothetical protein SAICODRAFT_170393 [Saitoella complicata NRRL Y-17804]|uniref:uncharacterized protein n=1 Tax=Saitoella complicata (strain BCRC 22490 / CBS 7301 / JCM 7358 / NBRC 10748 / NRRL Y-17804) TaxID=698492 RepID=UPI000866C61A|nr:uncharacterized protein SAICODRAFT_170393 [Saitoella complicata NRRL Y-17804]ODQ50557.1 hypothetical protein SAICODRAFT_170393 [Saitoella complicata NRRL Y-17804]
MGLQKKGSPARLVFRFSPSITRDGLLATSAKHQRTWHFLWFLSFLHSATDLIILLSDLRKLSPVSIISLKIADLAVELLSANMSRKELCKKVLQSCNTYLETEHAGRELVQELSMLKKKLAKAWVYNCKTPLLTPEYLKKHSDAAEFVCSGRGRQPDHLAVTFARHK